MSSRRIERAGTIAPNKSVSPDVPRQNPSEAARQRTRELARVRAIFKNHIKGRKDRPLPAKSAIDAWFVELRDLFWCADKKRGWAPRQVLPGTVRQAINTLSVELTHQVVQNVRERGASVLADYLANLRATINRAEKHGAGLPKQDADAPEWQDWHRNADLVLSKVEQLLNAAGWKSVGRGNRSPVFPIVKALLDVLGVPKGISEGGLRNALEIRKRRPVGEYWLDRRELESARRKILGLLIARQNSPK